MLASACCVVMVSEAHSELAAAPDLLLWAWIWLTMRLQWFQAHLLRYSLLGKMQLLPGMMLACKPAKTRRLCMLAET